ncbi:MAG: FdhF/YdeP family oxidoreductase [Pseudomonadota bacterium]|nr:FdhF/YdeP family oxidoreductase [Pseudomonadota bacterium]
MADVDDGSASSQPMKEIPSGGWGSTGAVVSILAREHVLLNGTRVIVHQNKPHGFACVSCSWAKPAHPHSVEACENGIKATAWEITPKRTTPDFFRRHTLTELKEWSDFELEDHGRLTHPMRWDGETDKYVEVTWAEAFEDIGERLKKLDPKAVVFYASGRASLETAYMYQLFARMYGSNNLPDSSNMCHESTSVALPKTIGVGIGTVSLDDFEATDCLFFFGQNVGTNSPRMLHQLQEARRRGAQIITFNPLREPGLVSFINPLSPVEMLTDKATPISTQYHQVKVGGDIAAITGMCKALIAADDAAVSSGSARLLDAEFIASHTDGFDEFARFVRDAAWEDIERDSGLTKAALEEVAEVYGRSNAVIGVYGMGLTQHRLGVQNVQMVSNFLLLRGNIGKPGAGICPVRGHSNVQGQRTVGITEKPELAPLDALAKQYAFSPPRYTGLNTVEACGAILDGGVQGFIGLGGNFIRAVPETARMERAWEGVPLTVQIATKLNRSHLIHGTTAYLLPCRGRIEIDRQASGPQSVTMEDSTGCMHGSRGVTEPAAATLLSEPAIVAGMARATLPANSKVPWETWTGDYAKIREAIAVTYPDIFHDFNSRLWTPGGFRRPVPAAHRQWRTPNGKANFIVPDGFAEDPDVASGADILRLTTIRSDDQFNTTVYSLNDRFRGIEGSRKVLFMHADDVAQRGLRDGDVVTASTAASDGYERSVDGLRVQVFNIPKGCAAGYFPECNPLIPLWHHAIGSKVPAAKSVPIKVAKL